MFFSPYCSEGHVTSNYHLQGNLKASIEVSLMIETDFVVLLPTH